MAAMAAAGGEGERGVINTPFGGPTAPSTVTMDR